MSTTATGGGDQSYPPMFDYGNAYERKDACLHVGGTSNPAYCSRCIYSMPYQIPSKSTLKTMLKIMSKTEIKIHIP